MSPAINKIKNQIVPLCKKYNCKKVALFGSYAKNVENEKSDIDILIEPPPKFGLIRFATMKLELQKTLQKNVDLLTYQSISPYLRDSILKSAYTLYEV